MAKIYVFLADGCEEIEALTPVDLLRRAGEDVCTVSIMGRKEVTGSHKITILADETIEEGEFDDGDMLVLPGGMPGTLNLAGNETLAALIRSYDDQGKKLAAICAAPSILGVMGILKDKNAVCFPGFEEKLAGANVLDVPAVTDKNVTTGRTYHTHDIIPRFLLHPSGFHQSDSRSPRVPVLSLQKTESQSYLSQPPASRGSA